MKSTRASVLTFRGLDWRVELVLILSAAIVVRGLFFVGFGFVDDSSYLDCIGYIIEGSYPPLDPLNQYAYRPLLLYLFAGGVALFGLTDLGVVVTVLLASLATTALVYLFVRRLIDPGAARWCALLFAFQPFNVVNSTTMTNDVILSCLVFASFGVFLLADRQASAPKRAGLFVGSAALMIAAFLVKITILPALCALGLYSLTILSRRRPALRWTGAVFPVAFALSLACICFVYYAKTGDWLWQFRSELLYYDTYKPDGYAAGAIDYQQLLWEYPRSLFMRSGYYAFGYFEHGLLFWLFVPASVWCVVRHRQSVLLFLIGATVAIFVFFEFFPQYLVPYYMPIVRQNRYLEMLLPGVVIVVGAMLHRLSQSRQIVASAILCLVLGHFVSEAAARSFQYVDSQRDMRELAEFAASTVLPSNRSLVVDPPARTALSFYLRDTLSALDLITFHESLESRESYVAVGGARPMWWTREQVLDLAWERVPSHWVLTYEVNGAPRPWRPSNLRVYYVPRISKDEIAELLTPASASTAPVERDLRPLSLSIRAGACGPS